MLRWYWIKLDYELKLPGDPKVSKDFLNDKIVKLLLIYSNKILMRQCICTKSVNTILFTERVQIFQTDCETYENHEFESYDACLR